MSYEINVDVIKMNIVVPADRIQELFTINEYVEDVKLSKEGIELNIDEQNEGKVVPRVGKNYIFNRTNVPSLGGNRTPAEEFFTELAVRFKGDFEARFSGEDGETWAVKVVEGIVKKVRVVVLEE